MNKTQIFAWNNPTSSNLLVSRFMQSVSIMWVNMLKNSIWLN